MKYLSTFLACILLSFTTLAQKEVLKTRYNSNGTIGYRSYDVMVNPKLITHGKEFLTSELQLTTKDSFRLIKTTEEKGYSYQYYQQYYQGFKVLYATYTIQAKNGNIESIHGYYKKVENPSISVSINETSALEKVLRYLPSKKYGWQDSLSQRRYKDLKHDLNATLYPKGELIIIKDDSVTNAYRLAYQFHVYSVQPLMDYNVYVDAITGNIISKENLIVDNNTPGTGSTLYSGTRNIKMDPYLTPTKYRLEESRPGVPGATINIKTYNMNNTGVRSNTDFQNTSTTWATDAGIDVHWGTEEVCDYWSQVRKRNSYDGQSGDLIGYVHADLPALNPTIFSNNDNAFWEPSLEVMTYGDGTLGGAEVSIDIIGHEIGHGICQSTAKLQSGYNESAALNEGLSDIWGAVIKNYADPSKNIWLHDDEINYAIRSINYPKQYQNPDTYHGQYWDYNNEPHKNSTVLSHWFYLLSVGGVGGNGYNVSGIGIDKAAAIIWEAESVQINNQPLTDYAGMRDATIDAATVLYCANSPEVMAVTNAWYAVGVGSVYNQLNLMSISGQNYICTSSAYTVIHQPSGISSMVWSTSTPSVATINTSGTATKVSNGAVYIYAGIYGSSGCSTTLTSSSIPVGITRATVKDSATPNCDGSIQTWVLSAVPSDFGSNWNWTVGSLGTNAQIYILSPYSSYTFADVIGGGTVNLTYTDACGNHLSDGGTVYSTCHSGYAVTNFTVAPNPAQNDITVSALNTGTLIQAKAKSVSATNLIYGIKITDALGILRKSYEYKTGIKSIKISVTNLNAGVYSLSVFDGQKWQSQNVIVQK